MKIRISKGREEKRSYQLVRKEYMRFDDRIVDNRVMMEADLSWFTQLNDGSGVFLFEVKSHEQTYKKGLYALAWELAPIRDVLKISTDENGMIKQLINYPEIKEKFNEMRPGLISKYKNQKWEYNILRQFNNLLDDEKLYTQSLQYAFPYGLIFQDYYTDYSDENTANGKQKILNFLGASGIPLITTHKAELVEDILYDIRTTAKVDEDNFDREAVARNLRTFQDNLFIRTKVETDYVGRALLDTNGWPKDVMQMTKTEVKGTIYQEEMNVLKEIVKK